MPSEAADGLMFSPWDPTDVDGLVQWVVDQSWDNYVTRHPTPETVGGRVAEGFYAGPDCETWWIQHQGADQPVGLVRLHDLQDTGALFDVYVCPKWRGRGVGLAAVRWLTRHLFHEYPHVMRIEAQTRADNRAMRVVLRRAGYVKEAYYRASWPTETGELSASVGYAMLRQDFATGHTTPVDWDDEP